MAQPGLITLRSIHAVHVRRMGDANGAIKQIPKDARVYPCGYSRLANMVEIVWQGERYAVFEVDLRDRTAPLESLAASHG
jgi:hypothetical protein